MAEFAKTKVCSIFEPTYKSIMTLPTENMRLRMFIALCDYAFDEIEPEFGSENEERILAALWEQFRVVFIQAKRRSKINSINGMKGGRPKKPTESNWFSEEKQLKPTNTITSTNTYTVEEPSASDLDFVKSCINYALEIEDCNIFSEDFYPSLFSFINENGMNLEEIQSYITFVGEYSKSHAPDNRVNYFYSIVTKTGMYDTYLNSSKEIL